jgi:glycosyltransferase involved in cell wall biosynthesis
MKRPALLARNLRSLVTQTVRPNEVFVVSTHPDVGDVRALIDESEVGSLPLHVVHAAEGRPSRTAALRAGLEASGSDYTWFLDDDDWAATSAVASMVGAVHAYDRPIIVGAVESASEVWKDDTLAESTFIRRYEPGEWHRAFTGWNHLPNCALVIPTDVARSRLSEVDLRSDLGEDYALQLALFTSPGATVTVVDETLAHVSVRVDADNAVTLEDREPWLRDLGSHISDLSNDPHTATDAFWRLGAAVRSIPYPAPVRPESPSAADDVHHPKRFFRRGRG